MERPIERQKDREKHRPLYRITETVRCREVNYTKIGREISYLFIFLAFNSNFLNFSY